MTLSNDKKQALKLTTLITVSRVLLKILTFPVGIITASILGPALLGLLKIAQLIISYASYSQIGFLQTLLRQLSIALSEKNPRDADEVQDVVFSANTLTTLAVILFLAVALLAGFSFKGLLTPLTFVLLCIIVGIDRMDGYLQSYIKSFSQFGLLTKRQILVDSISPFFLLTFIFLWKINGALGAILISRLIGITAYLWKNPIRIPRWNLSGALLKKYFPLSLTLYSNKMAESVFWLIDSTVIGVMLPPDQLGLYAFGLTIVSFGSSLTEIISTMMYRKILHLRGRKGERKEFAFLASYLDKPMLTFHILSVIFIFFSCFLAFPMIEIFLKDFRGTLPLLPVLAVGQAFFIINRFPTMILNVSNQLNLKLVLTILVIVLNLTMDILVLKSKGGIVAVAWVSTLCYVIYTVFLMFAAGKRIYGNYAHVSRLFTKLALLTIGAFVPMYVFAQYPFSSFLTSHLSDKIILFAMKAGESLAYSITSTLLLLISFFLVFRGQGLAREFYSSVGYVIQVAKQRLSGVKSA